MLQEAGDKDFVALFDLARAELAEARQAAERGDLVAAADAVLEAISSRPLRAYNTPDEALELGRILARDCPSEIQRCSRQVALWKEPSPEPAAERTIESLLCTHDLQAEVRGYLHRARGILILAKLFAMTGDLRWRDEAVSLIRELPSLPETFDAYADFVPLMPWHPNYPGVASALSVEHIIQNLAVALPVFWSQLAPETLKHVIRYMVRNADLCFRGMKDDPPYNIALHGLVAALGTAALFPQLKNAPVWKAAMDQRFSEGGAYCSLPFARQGYFGEGLGYQNVNQILLARSWILYDRAASHWGPPPPALERCVREGFELAAANLRPDGALFLVGDAGGRASWEHELDPHEILHLGAAVFNRPDWKLRAGGMRGAFAEPLLAFLMGLERYLAWREMPGPRPDARTHSSAAFPAAGFVHLKAGRGLDAHHGLLNASLGHNHVHSDCLSIALYGLGRELVSDPGGRSGHSPHAFIGFDEQSAHASCRLGHLPLRGPRHVSYRWVKPALFAESDCGRIRAAVSQHSLIEDHLHRRALFLCLPFGPDDERAFWIVWDRLAHSATDDGSEPPPAPNAPAPRRVTETTFPLHACDQALRIDGLSAWSLHQPGRHPRRAGEDEPDSLAWADFCRAVEHADSDANVQVSGVPHVGPDSSIGLESFAAPFAHFGAPFLHPVLSFKWRGLIPHEAAYVLAPFRGVSEKPLFRVEGWCGDRARPGALDIRLETAREGMPGEGRFAARLKADGLAGNEGVAELSVEGERAAVLEFEI